MFLDKEFIGQKLKEYRKKANLGQEQVAEKSNIAEKHYGRIERGYCMPNLVTFFKLIKTLNIPLIEFGIKFDNTNNNLRDALIKDIYLLNHKELEACTTIINSIKRLNE